MSIHQASIKDIQAILFVINKSNSEAYRKVVPPEYFKEPVLTPDGLLKESGKMIFYAHKTEDVTVGVAALRAEDDNTGQIRWVYVLPDYQRKGVGTSLLNHIENEATRMRPQKAKSSS